MRSKYVRACVHVYVFMREKVSVSLQLMCDQMALLSFFLKARESVADGISNHRRFSIGSACDTLVLVGPACVMSDTAGLVCFTSIIVGLFHATRPFSDFATPQLSPLIAALDCTIHS